jgi:hypothetical protein
MRRFKSARHFQRFAVVHDQIANLIMHSHYHTDASKKRTRCTQVFEAWESVTGTPMLERLAASVRDPYALRVRSNVSQRVDSTGLFKRSWNICLTLFVSSRKKM